MTRSPVLRVDQIKINWFFQVAWNQASQKCSQITLHSKSHQPQEYLQRNRLSSPQKKAGNPKRIFIRKTIDFQGLAVSLVPLLLLPSRPLLLPAFNHSQVQETSTDCYRAKVTFWHDAGVTFPRHSTSFSLKVLVHCIPWIFFSGY